MRGSYNKDLHLSSISFAVNFCENFTHREILSKLEVFWASSFNNKSSYKKVKLTPEWPPTKYKKFYVKKKIWRENFTWGVQREKMIVFFIGIFFRLICSGNCPGLGGGVIGCGVAVGTVGVMAIGTIVGEILPTLLESVTEPNEKVTRSLDKI